MTKYIVQYRVHAYEGNFNPNREDSFDDLRVAIKWRDRINRFISSLNNDRRFLGNAYEDRRETFYRAMTDSVSFTYTSRAKIIQRTIEEKEIE